MGMYDTIEFEEPVSCTSCRRIIKDVQTKYFNCTLTKYRVSDLIMGTFDTHIFREMVYCCACKKDIQNVFIVIKNGILIAVEKTNNAAERALKNFDKLDMLELYSRTTQTKNDYTEKFNGLYHDLNNIVSWYSKTPKEQKESKGHVWAFAYRNYIDKDILTVLRGLLEGYENDGEYIDYECEPPAEESPVEIDLGDESADGENTSSEKSEA